MAVPTRQPINALAEERITAELRLILAAAALLITLVAPGIPPIEMEPWVLAVLALYTAYGLLLYTRVLRQNAVPEILSRSEPWLDLAWAAALMLLDEGVNTSFFLLMPFAILVAALRWGRTAGLTITSAAILLFLVSGLLAWPESPDDTGHFLVRTVMLGVFGYIMVYWGDTWVTLQRRLALLKEVTTLSNPRFGVNRTFGVIVERLRTFYDADNCLLVLTDPTTDAHHILSAGRHAPPGTAHDRTVPAGLAGLLTEMPPDLTVVFCALPRWRDGWLVPRYQSYDVREGKPMETDRAASDRLAATLDAACFVTVPVRYRTGTGGRLYLTAQQRTFDLADAEFLLQVLDHVAPLLDNIRLVDQLATQAAEEERQRIARDLHDSVIQPYIGLQMGLAAVQRKLPAASPTAAEIDKLMDLTTAGIADLRRYVRRLRAGGEREESLLQATRRFASKFSDVTGVAVQVEAVADIPVNDRLAAEIFQMVAEGLSNIRRHTQAGQAKIEFDYRDGNLILRICNEGGPDSPPQPFQPRSITERATALGGSAQVKSYGSSGTAIVITIPL